MGRVVTAATVLPRESCFLSYLHVRVKHDDAAAAAAPLRATRPTLTPTASVPLVDGLATEARDVIMPGPSQQRGVVARREGVAARLPRPAVARLGGGSAADRVAAHESDGLRDGQAEVGGEELEDFGRAALRARAAAKGEEGDCGGAGMRRCYLTAHRRAVELA